MRLRQSEQMPIFSVFYHRVADYHENPWTISNALFLKHLDWLQDNVDLVSLSEAQSRIRSGKNSRTCVAITFDDGYADNCHQAIPALIERRIPCTYFVTSSFLQNRQPFPHDAKLGVPLEANSIEQILAMSAAGIEIGAHTRSHIDLGRRENRSRLRDELIGSIEDLERILGKPVRYAAFPYGLINNCSQEAIDLCADAGLKGFCTAYGDINWPGQNDFHIKRIHADPSLPRLRNWLTFDPRKVFRKIEFPFQLPTPSSTKLAPQLPRPESVTTVGS